ncbi:alkylation response protein AidB-like acyl-CoA dehydrogenase [Streptomyces sp. PanSC19]|uniref:acyl-CoA dehydrogenase family protein n=1 Tax=Streptomyces sp. PanSC19 TaxID=1520455 RepID=UPI000F4AC7D3|nr:acyl-CoA dehydrogenase family protein [Streptomyces sp. PanSC19]ROQ24487.1 alkylation response protein AidB-like acyl-CoA dehydrogenase [Streptomyces sp. PanSC19]
MDTSQFAPPTEPLTEERQEIRRTLRELLGERAGAREDHAAATAPHGGDTTLWTRLSGALGLAGLTLPEEYGGAGRGPAELAPVCEETGRALAPSPLLATTVLAAPLLTALGTPAQRAELLPRVADSTLTCALAVPSGTALALGLTGDNADGDWSGGGRAGGIQAARATDGGWRLYGEAAQVLDGHTAGLLLVAAHTGGFARSRTLLFLVPADAPGLVRTRQPALDPTRPRATVQFRDTGAELLGEEPADVLGALAATGRAAAAMLAAEAVGAAAAALDHAVGRVRSRERSAARHRLADLCVQVGTARSLTYCAARAPGSEGGPLALAHALEALRAAAEEALARDEEAHPYFERAASDELLFGPARRLRARAAERTGLLGEEAA